MVPGTASRLANDEMLDVRAYLNEGGRLLYTGKYAGFQYAFGYEFDPVDERAVRPGRRTPTAACRCRTTSCSTTWGPTSTTTTPARRRTASSTTSSASTRPFEGLSWAFGAPSANNQDHSASFIATSGILPAGELPAVHELGRRRSTTARAGRSTRTRATYYMYSQIADISYKRLTHTIDLTGSTTAADLSFWISRDTEPDWDSRLRRGAHGRARTTGRRCRTERAHEHRDRRELPGGLA